MDANMPGDCAQDDLSVPFLGSADLVKIYPNPAKDKLYISCKENSSIRIHDLHGQLQMNTFTNNGSVQLGINKLSPGAYFVTVKNKLGRFTQKIIKQ